MDELMDVLENISGLEILPDRYKARTGLSSVRATRADMRSSAVTGAPRQ